MRARLINPELVTVQPLARASMRTDTGSREPVASLPRATAFTILAQVDTTSENRRRGGQGGAQLEVRATLTFLRTAVDAASWDPTDGDLVVAVADRDGGNSRPVRWYLAAPQYLAKEHHRAKLVVMEVSERPPSRGRAEGL